MMVAITPPSVNKSAIVDAAEIVICHGGRGSIITPLLRGCHVIVIPRQFDLGEHYDDHQSEIASAFEQRGLMQVARDYPSFVSALGAVKQRVPRMATTDPRALADWLRTYIATNRAPSA